MNTSIRMKYLTRGDIHKLGDVAGTIRDRVEEALAVKGMTQRKFGERAGITNRSYQSSWWGGVRKQINRGSFNPSLGHVLRFARALKVKPEELLEEFK